MAKVTGQSIPPEFSEATARLIRATSTVYGDFARQWFQLPAPDAPSQIARQNYITAAAAQWLDLAPWKRTRWTICAYRNGNPAEEPAGYDGVSGFSLYLRCMIEQTRSIGFQPISPCSRRATDPGASPFDFTP